NLLDAALGLGALEADEFQEADLGNGIAVAAAGDDQDLDNRQGKRDAEADGGALADGAVDVDRAADLLDIGLDDVHTDAAPGERGHGRGCREAGKEDQAQQRLRAHARGLLGGDELLLDGLMLDAFGVDAAAVVADFDVDLAALVIGPQPDAAVARLAGRGAALGRFDAMVDGVAHQVRQRVTDRLDQSLVQLG